MSDRRRSSHGLARAVLRTIFVYSTLVLVYLIANSIAHQETMAKPLTHFFGAPTEGFMLALTLACSMTSFFLLRAQAHVRELSEGEDR